MGGERGRARPKRVGCHHPDPSRQPNTDANPRPAKAKRRGLSSSAACGRSHRRGKNTPKLHREPGGEEGEKGGNLKLHSRADHATRQPGCLGGTVALVRKPKVPPQWYIPHTQQISGMGWWGLLRDLDVDGRQPAVDGTGLKHSPGVSVFHVC